MTQDAYLAQFKKELDEMLALTSRKNADYADDNDAFANFKIIEHLSANRITAAQGFVVRMSDKLQRIVNLTARENKVADEKITDTLRDLAVYCLLFKIYLED